MEKKLEGFVNSILFCPETVLDPILSRTVSVGVCTSPPKIRFFVTSGSFRASVGKALILNRDTFLFRIGKILTMSSLPLPIAGFVAGVVSFLSPCLLAFVPGYSFLLCVVGLVDLLTTHTH